ncbi:MAG: hypothetical protein A2542_00120 [Parcubacteria group bacterium RIFOXYD2_FULL_52_8]|nr:MAG: hypothetical protein A2542_00120 [Parcubacteria group bacterium RIFOXYD2_FULL_52_8]
MVETSQRGAVEAEIAQLAKQIEAKRRLLESEHGIVDEKDAVRHVVAEKFGEAVGQLSGAAAAAAAAGSPVSPAPTGPTVSTSKTATTYLDTLDDDTVAKINALIASVFEHGLEKTIKTVVEEDPFVLDAFHDALVDKLYDELKKHNVVQ